MSKQPLARPEGHGRAGSGASPGPPLRGRLRLPGDKSISHRALLLAGLARGRSTIEGLNMGADVMATAEALRSLGVGIELPRGKSKGAVDVESKGLEGMVEPEGVLDCGNSGTTMRLLLGVCAGVQGSSVLSGDETLRERPMLRVVAPLRAMGAGIEGRREGDLAPLHVRGGSLEGVTWDTGVASAQVKSALLLAALAAEGDTSVTEPIRSRDHTERMLAHAGIEMSREGTTVTLPGRQQPAPGARRIPGDISSAIFLVVASALIPRSHLVIEDVGLNPTRTGGLELLGAMGADLAFEVSSTDGGEPSGHVEVRASDLHATSVTAADVPALIDEIPALAIAATQAEGSTRFEGAGELRVKESDRVEALVDGIRALGGAADELPDGLVVHGPRRLAAGSVDARGDHRIALAFAIAGLVSGVEVEIDGWGSIETSFPDFSSALARARGE